MGQRDIQAELGIANAGTLTLLTASVPETVLGTVALDTKGMRAFMFALEWSSVLTAGDEIKLEVAESDTSGGTYTEVASAKMLPSRREGGDQFASVTGPTSPYLQTWGAFGTKRWVKARATSVVMAANEDAQVYMIFRDEFRPVERWDPDYTSVDGNP